MHLVQNSWMNAFLSSCAAALFCAATLTPAMSASGQPPPVEQAPTKITCQVQVPPRVPLKAIREGISGTVVARTRVRNGTITEVLIVSGPDAFRDAVATALSYYSAQSFRQR